MALGISVYGIEWGRGTYTFKRLSGNFGNLWNLTADPRFRRIQDEKTGYLDYFGVLSAAETLEIAGAVAQSRKFYSSTQQESFESLKASLEGVGFVLVHIFEWESGL